ncbi:MAG TPA: tetratricopeptide repeat protein [Opitutaceae bacterium]|nr:tetratricopeptide repeat protein [Opitutaceae bacterium]
MKNLRAPWIPALLGVLLVLATVLVYLPVRHHGFVAFDDPEYVTENRMVQQGLTWAGVKWAFTTGDVSYWHPLTWLSHMLDVQWFGADPAGAHLVNVFFHVANTLLLFLLLRRLTGALWRTVFVAALFALHPLHVESVAWIAERKDVLSSFFFLLTLCAYLHYARPSAANPLSRPGLWYAGALLFFACGLMSKPMVVTLPCVLLLLDYWPLGRWETVTPRRLVLEKVPFFLLSAGSCVVTFAAQKQNEVVQSLERISMLERVQNAFVAYATYLGKTFWPADLAFFYPHPESWAPGRVIAAVVLIVVLTATALWLGRKFPFAAVGWFLFLGMLVPTIGIIQVGDQSMADRYTYLPLIGVFILLAWSAAEIGERWKIPRSVSGIAAAAVMVACGVQTTAQLRHWRDSETLFRRALAVTTRNYIAHTNLGNVLVAQGKTAEAIGHYEQAGKIRPGNAEPFNNLGTALLRQKRVEEAIRAFEQALKIDPQLGTARHALCSVLLAGGRTGEAIPHLEKILASEPGNAAARRDLGFALLQTERPDEAIPHLEAALKTLPGSAAAHYDLAIAFFKSGRTDASIPHFQKAAEEEPQNPEFLNNLGWALLQNGNVDEAIARFRAVLKMQPDSGPTHQTLAIALLRKGQAREAITHYQSFLTQLPNDARALSDLAWVLATWPEASVRDGPRALELARRANQVSGGQEPEFLRSLAAAEAENGRFADAVKTARLALRHAEAQANPELADALRLQLKHYETGAPFHGQIAAPHAPVSTSREHAASP